MNDSWQRHFSMPLLTKELAEQAARPRTYLVRFCYTAALFGIGLFIIYGRGASGGVARLGGGQEMFEQMYWLQLAAIAIVMPAICAGALAGEKERESLSLLLLTTIPAPLIVVQKLLSRLIPMMAFVILSFPLMATAYSFGGVATQRLILSLLTLVLMTVFTGSVSIMCSAYCRTTLEAYMATYLCLLFSFPILSVIFMMNTEVGRIGQSVGTFDLVIMAVFASGLLIPISLVAMGLASVFLYNRAFIPPKNLLLGVFKQLDQFFNGMNTVTGGVVLVQDGDPYPADDPITWRETAKRSLGTFRYLFRVITVIELPILFVAQIVRLDSTKTHTAMSDLLEYLWGAALILTSVHSSSVISAERSRQTLDVLLVAPMTGREMIERKLSGVNRLFWMLMVPFSTIFLFQQWFYGLRYDLRYLILQYGSVFAGLTLVRWMGMAIGLVSRTQMRATMTLLAILAAVILAGPVFNFALDLTGYPQVLVQKDANGRLSGSLPALRMLPLLTPASWLRFVEDVFPAMGGQSDRWVRFGGLGSVVLLYAMAAWGLRAWILASADAFLGRVRPGTSVPPREDQPELAPA